MVEPWRLTATESVRAIRAGWLSPESLIESCLERALACEPQTHAFAHLDPALALAEATRCVALGVDTPLAGVPFAVKDNLDTALAPTANGSAIWAGHRPRADAAAVALTRRAGGAYFGKTAMTEFAAMTPAATTNPANHAHSPGGSSSGSAAAVAEGSVPLALGTQTGGSVIRPAAYCGVVGFKPSFGAIHRSGLRIMSESLDTIGILARSVADCALLFCVLTGLRVTSSALRPDRAPRLAFTLGPAADRAARETVELIERAAKAFARAGATVSWPRLPPVVNAAFHVHETVMYGETVAALSWERETAPGLISPRLSARLDEAAGLSTTEIARARRVQENARRAFDEFGAHFDAIVTPSAPGQAPAMASSSTGDMAFNQLWTALHAACVTVPAGLGPNRLPLGLQIVTPRGSDIAALSWAEWASDAIH
jgi:amidase